MSWYDNAVFYYIHPLSLCGCEHESIETKGSHFDKLAEWAKHAKDMGCNAIFIGPVFTTEAHGYGINDYYKIDQRLGTNEDFKSWVAGCHKLGMHVVADCSFNHVGRGFFAFLQLKKDKRKSSYKEWFSDVNFFRDNTYGDGLCYENWGGYDQLVKINLLNPWVVDYFLDVVRFWINELGIDGLRINAVDEMDYDFIKEVRKTAEREKLDFFLMGDFFGLSYTHWVNDKMLHSAANNELQKALIFAHNDCGYPVVAKTLRDMNEQCPQARLYTFVDNYDVSHIYEKLNKPEHRYLVSLLQYTVPGIPSLYNGSEFSFRKIKKAESEESEEALRLADYKNAYLFDEITHLHCLLGRIRQQFPVLSQGCYKELLLADDQFAFAMVLDKSAMITVVNNENRMVRVEIPLPIHAKKAIDMLEAVIDWNKEPKESLDISKCREFSVKDNELLLELPANGGSLILVTA